MLLTKRSSFYLTLALGEAVFGLGLGVPDGVAETCGLGEKEGEGLGEGEITASDGLGWGCEI